MTVGKQIRTRRFPSAILTPDNIGKTATALFAIVLGLLVFLTFGVTTPQRIASLSTAKSTTAVLSDANMKHIESFIGTLRPDDPLITLAIGVQVKRSNYYGINLDGTTYYYDLRPHQSFDPLSRGEISPEKASIVYRETDDPEFPFTIYTVQK